MVKKINRKAEKDKRHLRVRKKISGTAECPQIKTYLFK